MILMSNTELIYFKELCNKTQMIYLTLIKDIKNISAQILLILDDFIIYGSPGSLNFYIQFLHFPLMGTMPKLNWNRSQVLFIFDQTRLSTYYLQNEICNTTNQ